LQKKIMLGLLLLTFVLVGVKVVPGIADSQGPEEIALTLEQAVEMAIANNPQVGMAQADKKKKEISYKQAKDAGAKVEDTPMEATYEGKLMAKLKPKIAEREGEQAAKVYDITINGVKVQAENAYYNLIQAREKQEIASNTLKRADEQLRIAQLRYELGTAAKVEVLAAEAGQAAARAGLTAARNNYKQSMLELNKCLAIDLETTLKPSGVFQFEKEEFLLQDLLDRAMVEDMSIIKAQDTYEMAKWSYDLLVSLYGSTFYETRKAEQDRVAAQLFLEQTKNDLVTKVHKNYYAYLALEEQYQYLLKNVEVKQEAYRLTQLSYENGLATLNEIQEASDALKEAEVNLSDCIFQYNTLKSSMKYSLYQ
jgi:outer membrane protein